MNDLLLLVSSLLSLIFGFSIARMVALWAARDLQFGTPRRRRGMVLGVLGILGNIAFFSVINAVKELAPLAQNNPNASELLLFLFISVLGGIGLGLLWGLRGVFQLASRGWEFYSMWTELYTRLGEPEAEVLVLMLSPRRGICQRLRDWWRRRRGLPNQTPQEIQTARLESAAARLGISVAEVNHRYANALRILREYIETNFGE